MSFYHLFENTILSEDKMIVEESLGKQIFRIERKYF